jgi:HK97 family phage prohead protease
MTNFPTKGEDKKISLRNSNYPQFDFDFANNVKEQTPEIWKAGGNIRGNEAFNLWKKARAGEETEGVLKWIKEREAWVARHFEDGKQFKKDLEPNLSNVAGVVAQMKWGAIGTLGEQGMKDVILELTKKLEGKKDDRQVNATIQKGLENKVEKHNEEVKDLDVAWNPRVTYKTLLEVFERGLGAYKSNPESVRPNVSGPDQWAYARVNSFLFALKKGRFQGGKHDTDLLPNNHPVKKDMEENKIKIMEKVKRELIGSMITDGIEMPLFTTKEEAEEMAKEMGAEGENLSHEHTLNGETVFMPFGSHEEIMAVMNKEDEEDMEENEHIEGHEEEEEEKPMGYRSNPNKEVRTFNVQNLELREEGDSNVVVGYASVFNTLSNDLGNFKEIISPDAFEGRLNDDVRFLINHEGLPLARTTNETLRLTTDETGLRYEAKVANTSLGRDLLELMRNGTINQSSFAFVVDDDSWEVKDGVNIRTINKVSRLYDVSAVTYPAYEEASVALRSMDEWKKDEETKVLKENLKKEKEEREREDLDLIKRNLRELRLSIINKK